MTRGRWKGIAVVSVLAVVALSVTVWFLYFKDQRTESNRKNDQQHAGSASGQNKGGNQNPAGDNPNRKPPKADPADPKVVYTSLDDTLKAVDPNVYWDKQFNPIATYNLRKDNGDLYLKWLYMEELLRLQGPSNVPELTQQKVKDQIEAVRKRIMSEKPEAQSYFHAYTQWYELICYCHAEDENLWIDGGAGTALLNDVLKNTATPGAGRARMDGSICSAMMYGALTLYYYSDRPNGAHLVGKRLGVYPADKKPAFETRTLVQILTRATSFIDGCYPEGVSTGVLGLRYVSGSNEKNGGNLVGGKILYYCSKAVLAREKGDLGKEKEYLEEGVNVVAGLAATKLPETPYGYAYVLRSTALLIRMYVVRQDWDRVRQLTTYAQQFLTAPMPPKSAGESSEFYLPLIYLQFRNEVREVMSDPVLLKEGVKKEAGI